MKYLFGLTAIAAIACVALVFATAWWAAVAFTASIVLLLASLVFCFAATGDRRWYWIGFAIFGWGYWIVLSLPLLSFEGTLGQWQLGGSRLVSEKILEWVYFHALPLVHAEPQIDRRTGEVLNGSRYPNSTDFMRVGHSLADLMVAVFGGLLGRIAYRRFRSGQY
jgi:energy-coupling factor transporter transmembrane protein EcfT